MGSLVGLGKGGSYHDGRCDHHQGEKLGAGRNLGCVGRQAELERFKHEPKIGETCPISLLGIFCDRTLTWVPALDGKCGRVSEFSHEEKRRYLFGMRGRLPQTGAVFATRL